jgi:pyridoxal phosphate enzyme (YggS family)
MSSITGNIRDLLKELPKDVTVVAVTKTRSYNEVLDAYNAGLRTFGENRVQELAAKRVLLPSDISWHLIGHLQSNKVKQAVSLVSMIESVDTVRLLEVIDKEAAIQGRVIDCLLQVHIASEETKFGFAVSEIHERDWHAVSLSLNSVRIRGLMGMASFTDDFEKVRSEFRTLATLFRETHDRCFNDASHFTELSMGMSGDWRVAVEEGSTMIRVGTLIFGERKSK